VPARPSPEIADKTSLLDLNDRICRWPMGHPGEPDFHFCGEKVNPGFPYCVEHCGRAYQAQLPRGAPSSSAAAFWRPPSALTARRRHTESQMPQSSMAAAFLLPAQSRSFMTRSGV
jgi:hypothetical protein